MLHAFFNCFHPLMYSCFGGKWDYYIPEIWYSDGCKVVNGIHVGAPNGSLLVAEEGSLMST
jgi:hypothetical protein